ncbi:MAG TPA: ferrochelatase [Gemmatimonadales bacterium]|nr:ferrochelatase [Gemmatimonadales bacterium]
MSEPIGVLVMAYGGPASLDEVEPYLLDVRGFRPTPAAVVAEVRERYARIGGRSPILERTEDQARALEASLRNGTRPFAVAVGMRHWRPYIRDTLHRMAEQGIRRAVGLVMAPHYSRMSIGAYRRAVEDAGAPVSVELIESWHLLPGYVAALAARIRQALERFPDAVRGSVPVIFTAHSLPARIVEWGDPYPAQLLETVGAVMAELGPRPHRFAYQSASHTGEPWLSPDVSEVLDELARAGAQHVLVAPVGFVSEHVEILYDLDIELAERARALGVHLERIDMLQDAPALIGGLADLVRQTARAAGWL